MDASATVWSPPEASNPSLQCVPPKNLATRCIPFLQHCSRQKENYPVKERLLALPVETAALHDCRRRDDGASYARKIYTAISTSYCVNFIACWSRYFPESVRDGYYWSSILLVLLCTLDMITSPKINVDWNFAWLQC